MTVAESTAACANDHAFEPELLEMEMALDAIRALWVPARALEQHAAALRARHVED